MATPAARGLAPTPPDKGSFPLDHFGDCKLLKAEYLMCLQRSFDRKTELCRVPMKQYLECRMQHGLMAQEDLSRLGFANVSSSVAGPGVASGDPAPATQVQSQSQKKA